MTKDERKAIEQFLVEECVYVGKFSDTGRRYCQKAYDDRCKRNGNMWTDYVQCPKDCPHHPDNLSIECKGTRCQHIKNKMKQIDKKIKEYGTTKETHDGKD